MGGDKLWHSTILHEISRAPAIIDDRIPLFWKVCTTSMAKNFLGHVMDVIECHDLSKPFQRDSTT